jgi:hypothetical protein
MGIIRFGNERDDENIATWYLSENPSRKSGILIVLTTAVLLVHPSDANFAATLDIQAEVDFRYNLSTAFKKMVSLVPKSDAISFNTKQLLGNIKVENLNALDKVDLLAYRNIASTRIYRLLLYCLNRGLQEVDAL